jgi:hypothetical protein
MSDKGPFLKPRISATAIAAGTLAIIASSIPSNATPGETNLSPAAVIPVEKLEQNHLPPDQGGPGGINLPPYQGGQGGINLPPYQGGPGGIESPYSDALEQVTSVSQLSDVNPTDWAFQALQSLVERYGCIAGYPDGSFRGDRPITRYEFAAALNACLERITEVFGSLDTVTQDDLDLILRFQEDFAIELAELENRIDILEFRMGELEAGQFSPTSKLLGEVIFGLNGIFSGEGQDNTVFQYRTRLVALASFTGKDQLWMRFVYASNANPPVLAGGTREIVQTYQYFGEIPDDIAFFSFLEYVFPVGEKMRVHVSGLNGYQWFGVNYLNPYFENFEGGMGSLSLFGNKNPVYRLGGGVGAGFTYQFNPALAFTAGYLAGEGSNPSMGAGLFDGNFTALAQITWTPSANFGLSVLYNRAHFDAGSFTFGDNSGVIRVRGAVGSSVLEDVLAPFTVNSNSYGGQFSWRASPKFTLSGWVGLTEVEAIDAGDGEIWNYALTFAFPDLGGPGHLGGVVLGVQPYLASMEGVELPNNDTSVHVEAFYRYQIREGIWLTPGLIWITAPNQNRDNEDIVLWTLRTTFLF